MITHVVDTLFLGDMTDALGFDGERLCVLEQPPSYNGQCYHIPILLPHPERGMVASRAQLDKAADCITARLAASAKLLVHCGAGIERSPLTVAWWLVKTSRCESLAVAYARLMAIRPVVQDRTAWLEPGLAPHEGAEPIRSPRSGERAGRPVGRLI